MMKQNVYSVGQINSYISNLFKQDFMLGKISIKGEVSNCKYHSSGHIYFTLKDSRGAISAVMFAGSRGGLRFNMKEGDNVVVTGSVEVYERDGKYQLYAREIILDGAGALFLKYEQLKAELEEMGMFSQEYKQQIPAYVRTLGVVTAPTGAAVRDIQNITHRRNPAVQVILYPARVQGEGSAKSIAEGIQALDQFGVDTIIVGRGGGSIEDLWAFNEELVARAIFNCTTPVISAVGHETDTTIADFVADLRAPTPSAAAELAVANQRDLLQQLLNYRDRLLSPMNQILEKAYNQVNDYQLKLKYLSPLQQLNSKKQRGADLQQQLESVMKQKLILKKHRLALLGERLEGNSPLKKLSEGFAMVTDTDGHTLSKMDQIETGQELKLHMLEGIVTAQVKDKVWREK